MRGVSAWNAFGQESEGLSAETMYRGQNLLDRDRFHCEPVFASTSVVGSTRLGVQAESRYFTFREASVKETKYKSLNHLCDHDISNHRHRLVDAGVSGSDIRGEAYM